MSVNYEDLSGPFGLALNEANLLGVVLDTENRSATVGFDCLSIRENAPRRKIESGRAQRMNRSFLGPQVQSVIGEWLAAQATSGR